MAYLINFKRCIEEVCYNGSCSQPMVNEAVTEISEDIPEAATTPDTTANLANNAAAVNVYKKFTGKCVFNTTSGKPVWAAGPGSDDVWVDATGATAHTPV